MSAYILVRAKVTDWTRYREYMQATPAVITQYGGRFIVRGGETFPLEGGEETARLVILEFPDMERAMAFYYSPEYEAAKHLREGAAEAQFIAVQGC
jgi:uncharacterized protein (DUF1330 family)